MLCSMGKIFTFIKSLKIFQFISKSNIFNQIPEEDVVDRQRFVVFRIFTYVAIFVSLGAFIKMYLTLKEVGFIPYFIPGLTLIIFINFIRIKSAEQLQKAYLLMLIAACALLHLVAYSCGGIQTGGTFFFMAVVMYAFMLLGRKGGLLITSIVVIHVIYLFIISSYTDWTSFDLFSNDEKLINEDFFINILLTLLLIASLSNYLQSNRNVIIQSILKSKKVLEQKNIELEEKQAILTKQYAELEKFASVAAHDLRAPLRAIGSLSDMLIEDVGSTIDEFSKANLNTIKGRVMRMDKLLQALLAYSRVDRRTDEYSHFNTLKLIQEIIIENGFASQAEILFDGDFPDIYSVKDKLKNIINELISNAIRFNSSLGLVINISCKREGEKLLFKIKDNGIGIDPAYHEKIFVIFQTLQARDEHECIGAGLAIVRKIIEEQRCKIGINSTEGHGAEFWFTWNPEIIAKPIVEDFSYTQEKMNKMQSKIPVEYAFK